MTTKEELISHCLTYEDVYEDYPFEIGNWCAIRHRSNKKCFAFVLDKDGKILVNLKCDPQWTQFWRSAFDAVIPGYHMNKTHWNSVIIDGTIPDEDLCRMIRESYELTKKR